MWESYFNNTLKKKFSHLTIAIKKARILLASLLSQVISAHVSSDADR